MLLRTCLIYGDAYYLEKPGIVARHRTRLVDGLRRHKAPVALQAGRMRSLGSMVKTNGPELNMRRTVMSGAGDPDREEQVMNQEVSPTVLAELQEQLGAHHQHLEAEIGGLRRTEGVGGKQEDDPSIEVRGDQGEASVEIEAWAIAHQEEVNLREQLAEVEHALSKFALGTYGRCEQCGQPIPLARLRAFPEARYDVGHQTEVEQRVRGTP